MDGDIDYSKYSAEDLNEALARIDKQRFPVRLAHPSHRGRTHPSQQRLQRDRYPTGRAITNRDAKAILPPNA
jgi:hypothetical protein